MIGVTRSMLHAVDGCLLPHRFLIHDRDPVFTDRFAALLRSAGVGPVELPPRSPNLNADAERFVHSIKDECLSRLIPIGERYLRLAVEQFAEHDHLERNHQGLGNRLIDGEPETEPVHDVACDDRLGGSSGRTAVQLDPAPNNPIAADHPRDATVLDRTGRKSQRLDAVRES